MTQQYYQGAWEAQRRSIQNATLGLPRAMFNGNTEIEFANAKHPVFALVLDVPLQGCSEVYFLEGHEQTIITDEVGNVLFTTDQTDPELAIATMGYYAWLQ